MRELRAEPRSPTARLVAGLAFTLLVIGAYAAYTVRSVHRMREMQSSIVERNRLASLQLIRIQNDLNALGLSLRDMLDGRDGYSMVAWRPALARIRENLENAIAREAQLSAGWRANEQTVYLHTTFSDFWRTVDTMFSQPSVGASREWIRTTLQPRQEALTAMVARLLVENNERDSQAALEAEKIYSNIERNAYLLLGVSVALIAITGVGLIRANRDVFARVASLAQERRDLAQQLIASQESTLRSISRDLHDEFGQILTAVGALLRRAGRHAPSSAFESEVQEVSGVVQGTLEKIRSLSQSLQPVILEEQGLLAAIQWHLVTFERHTGVEVDAHLPDHAVELPAEKAIHVYRILQEALNNVVRHAGVNQAAVRLEASDAMLRLVVEDQGKGIRVNAPAGVGLSAMRERAELVGGSILIGSATANGTGTRIVLEVPWPVSAPEPVDAKEALLG